MNISNGLDRVGKVVFWLSFLVAAIVTGLLGVGDANSNYSVILGALTLAIIAWLLENPKDKNSMAFSLNAYSAALFLWYNMLFVAYLMNKLPHADFWLGAVVYVVPVILFLVLKSILKYILNGFTQKT